MNLTRIALLATLLFGLASTLQAQQKIAVVNLRSIFDGYWKTKQSDATVKDRQADFEKERKKMIEDYQKANDEYRKLSDSASDPAISAEERERRKKTAESKLLEIKEIEQSIQQFDRQFRAQITDQIKRMRESIMREIREIINTKANAASYTLVVDTASESFNQTPIVLFSSGAPDLTDDVLKELNASAPAGALTTPAKPEEKPEEKK